MKQELFRIGIKKIGQELDITYLIEKQRISTLMTQINLSQIQNNLLPYFKENLLYLDKLVSIKDAENKNYDLSDPDNQDFCQKIKQSVQKILEEQESPMNKRILRGVMQENAESNTLKGKFRLALLK
jgi:hypothetical protein